MIPTLVTVGKAVTEEESEQGAIEEGAPVEDCGSDWPGDTVTVLLRVVLSSYRRFLVGGAIVGLDLTTSICSAVDVEATTLGESNTTGDEIGIIPLDVTIVVGVEQDTETMLADAGFGG